MDARVLQRHQEALEGRVEGWGVERAKWSGWELDGIDRAGGLGLGRVGGKGEWSGIDRDRWWVGLVERGSGRG